MVQKPLVFCLFFTVKEHEVNHSEALTRQQAQPDRGAMEQSLAWPCTTWLEASWSWSFLLQTGCCFPNRPPKAPKYCSTDHKLKLVLIHLSGPMAGSPHSRTLCCTDLNSFWHLWLCCFVKTKLNRNTVQNYFLFLASQGLSTTEAGHWLLKHVFFLGVGHGLSMHSCVFVAGSWARSHFWNPMPCPEWDGIWSGNGLLVKTSLK